jgi:hypothetical protein
LRGSAPICCFQTLRVSSRIITLAILMFQTARPVQPRFVGPSLLQSISIATAVQLSRPASLILLPFPLVLLSSPVAFLLARCIPPSLRRLR